ncbi:dephospho-CoA kinase [Salinibacterium sp. TMP30]|uniref:dephospho-CoA kinase n=1 Tax=Salinibacterium sp. TMP30 TaxID=3138237 RepID=UPI00313977E7
MHLIALTGGIASGKSTVARRWQEHGAVVVDADALAREVVEPGSPVLNAIAIRFGPEMLSPDGSLNRAALGAMIFGDAQARQALNGITHPAISRLAQRRFDEAERNDAEAIVVYDIPLLVESAQSLDRFEAVITVEAEPEVRVQRLIDHRGMARDEAKGRVLSQASSDERRAVADFVIDASGSLADTQNRADAVWSSLSERLRCRL